MKFVAPRPFADPEAAAQKLMEIANAVEAALDGRIFIELLNGPFLYEFKGSPAEYGAGLKLAIDRGRLWKHESGGSIRLAGFSILRVDRLRNLRSQDIEVF
jgi:hypothetical protein